MNTFDYFFQNTKFLSKDFIVGNNENISFQLLYLKSISLANYISREIGKNQNIIILDNNSLFFVIAYLAIIKSGNICVPLNPSIGKSNYEQIKKKCQCKFIFSQKNVSQKLESDIFHIINEDKLKEILSTTSSNEYQNEQNFDSNASAEILFTSGSTGKPKGVLLSHKNIISNTNSIIEYLRITESDTILVVLPFSYCYGLSLLHTHLRSGGSIVFNNLFVFMGSVIADLNKYACTGFAGVPSHYQLLLRKTKEFKKNEFPHLRYVTQAGGKLHDVFIKEFIEAFPKIEFHVMYGQTEATARLSHLDPQFLKDKIGSIGKAISGVTLEVRNEEGKIAKTCEIGEIMAKGDNIMLGYYLEEKDTKNTIKNGWLKTGDLAYIDEDGFIFITSRKKEIIKVNGNRISPKEIEFVILEIPEVVDCIIEGIDDEIYGEAIKSTIIVRNVNDHKLSIKSIKEYCSKKLPLYKIPHIIEFVSEINTTATGKEQYRHYKK